MTVTPFPAPMGLVQPILEICAPARKGGLYAVTLWQNHHRDDGFTMQVATLEKAREVAREIKERFEGGRA